MSVFVLDALRHIAYVRRAENVSKQLCKQTVVSYDCVGLCMVVAYGIVNTPLAFILILAVVLLNKCEK